MDKSSFIPYHAPPATSGRAAVCLIKKAAALQRSILSKHSATTANKLLQRLFSIYIFTRYRLESLLYAFFHSALATKLF